MPSMALAKFEDNLLVDVDRIIESHGKLNHDGGGRRGLGHITRSGVLMLCAAWELYLEEVLLESVHVFIKKLDTPNQLPKEVQKEMSKAVRDSKHELKPLELAGDGWKTVYLNHAQEAVNALNAPKSTNVDLMFKRLMGVLALSENWSISAENINAFVSARGDIAHRGRDAGYVTFTRLGEYREQVIRTVVDTDNALCGYIRSRTPTGKSPWRRRNP